MRLHAILPSHREQLTGPAKVHPLDTIYRIVDPQVESPQLRNRFEEKLPEACEPRWVRRRWLGAPGKGDLHERRIAGKPEENTADGAEGIRGS